MQSLKSFSILSVLYAVSSYAQHGNPSNAETIVRGNFFPKDVWGKTYQLTGCFCGSQKTDCFGGIDVKSLSVSFSADSASFVNSENGGLSNHIETHQMVASGKAKQVSELTVTRINCNDQAPKIDFDSSYIGKSAPQNFIVISGNGTVAIKQTEKCSDGSLVEQRYRLVGSSD